MQKSPQPLTEPAMVLQEKSNSLVQYVGGNIFWGAYNLTDFFISKAKFYNTKPLERAICSSTSCSDDIDRLLVDWIWVF